MNSRLDEAAQSDPQNSREEEIPGEGPVTFDTPGMCLMRFPLQKSILAVEFCGPDSCLEENSLEKENSPENKEICPEFPAVVPELCTLEVLDLGEDEPGRDRGTIPGDPCGSQTGISRDPCTGNPKTGSQTGISTDPCGSQTGISTDSCGPQTGISTDSCGSQTGISVDPCAPQTGISVDPCAPQTGISVDPCKPQIGISQSQGIGISTDPCASQTGISTDPCPSQPQGIGNPPKDGGSRVSPRSRSRLDSGTSSVVERCLARCQRWFRPGK